MNKFFRYIFFFVLAFGLTSCFQDSLEDFDRGVFQGDGKLVDITLNYNASEAQIVTKVLPDESERQVNDLFVLAFPVSAVVDGTPVFDNTKTVIKRYYTPEDVILTDAQSMHYNAGTVELKDVPTGTYVIIGVANVKTSEYGGEGIYSSLENVNSWDAYCNLTAFQTSKGSVDRISPSLLMSGSYRPQNYSQNHKSLCPVEIRNGKALSGYIHLVRVDARVKFVIKNAISRVKSFQLQSWQVFNIPDDVKLNTLSASIPGTVSNSSAFSAFTSQNNEHSFEFYIPESVFTSNDSSLDMIRKREKRNDDRSWVYAPQNAPYVVFSGKIEMLVNDQETGESDVNRYADVTFTVHLGACDGDLESDKAKDFKTERNTKYTYTITINGVNDVVVEAKKEGATEYNHGVEGVVIDNVGGVTFNFDSHYGIANIMLTKNDLKKMSLSLTSVVGDQHFNRDNNGNVLEGGNTLNIESEDFQAFRFAFEPVSSVSAYRNATPQIFRDRFVSYSETYDAGKYIRVLHNEISQAKDDNHTYALYDLKSMLECLPFGDGGAEYADQRLLTHLSSARSDSQNKYQNEDDMPLIFTVFVNENVYYKDVEDWHKHANTKDRVLRLFTSAALSSDGKSEYIRGRYNFDQKFCQTYYSDINDEALCVEFVNEHHHKDIKNTKGTNPGAGKSVKSGWQYVNRELEGKKWNDCSDQTIPLCDHYNAFRTLFAANGTYAKQIPGSTDANDYEAIYASLSRNRDLNRDGVINSNELKWFLASMEQYIQITIGGAALARKIFTPDDYYNWNTALEGAPGAIFGNVRFHYCGVETNSKFWSEEGYTVGNQSVANAATSSSGWDKNPWELLCVRMLVDHNRIHEEEIHWNDFDDLYHYSNVEKNVISMDKYRSNLHRQEISGWIDLHSNDNDIANSTFTHFQYAKADAALIDINPGELVLVDRMRRNLYCATYSEEADSSDVGTWRVPNQRETAVMRYLAGINNETQPNAVAYYLSCSTWPFPSNNQRTYNGHTETIDFCTIGMNPTKSSPTGQLSQNKLRVRCVRDTDSEGNFVASPAFNTSINFEAGDLSCDYKDGDKADYSIKALMNADMIASVSVTIDGHPASVVRSGKIYLSSISDVPVTGNSIPVVWTIRTTDGRDIVESKTFNMPALYWLISNIDADKRYATVNSVSNMTYTGPVDARNVNEIPSEFKWIITRNPSGKNIVNERYVKLGVTYYLYNAGTQQYISGPSSGSRSYMSVGGTPLPMQLVQRNEHPGYYVLRFSESTNANAHGGNMSNFGVDNSYGNGSFYKLTPAYMLGPLFLNMRFASDVDVVGENGIKVSATMHPEAVVTSVTINGVQAEAGKNSDGSWSAVSSGAVSAKTFTTVWTVTLDGKTYTESRTYNHPALTQYFVFTNYRASATRFAYVDQNTQTRLDASNNSVTDPEQLNAQYKWRLVKSTTDLTNVANPVDETLYYLYNAGYNAFLTAPNYGQDRQYFTVGNTPVGVKIISTVNNGVVYRTMYIVDSSNSRKGWINFLGNGFGYWNSGADQSHDNGNKWTFIPVTNVGTYPFAFTAGQFTTDYNESDGTRASFTFDAAFESGAELVSISFNGTNVPASAMTVSGTDIHCVLADQFIPENGRAEIAWTFRKNGSEVVKTHTYELPVKFYLMKSILSSESYGYQYVYVDDDGNTRSKTSSSDIDKSRAAMIYRWILSGDSPSSENNILASEVAVNGNRSLYLYNLSAQAYITKPSPTADLTDFLPTGSAAHRFCFDATKNGGFRPYFKWNGNNTFGSAADSNRSPDKNKFGFSQAGVDAAYWIFVPVYLDNGPEIPLSFEFGNFSETDGTYSVSATLEQSASIVSVTFDGVAATHDVNGTSVSASLPSASLTNPFGFTVTWTLNRDGQEYVRSKYYVAKNTPYWAFRHSDGSPRPYAYADNGIVKLKTESTPSDVSRWVLQEKVSGAFVETYSSSSSYSDLTSTQYVLFNIGTGMYLGPQNANNIMTMVSGKENAQAFVIRFNGNHECIHFVNPDGSHKGWALRGNNDTTVSLQVSDNPSHGWKLWYPDRN